MMFRFRKDLFGTIHYQAGGPDWLDKAVGWFLSRLFEHGIVEATCWHSRFERMVQAEKERDYYKQGYELAKDQWKEQQDAADKAEARAERLLVLLKQLHKEGIHRYHGGYRSPKCNDGCQLAAELADESVEHRNYASCSACGLPLDSCVCLLPL